MSHLQLQLETAESANLQLNFDGTYCIMHEHKNHVMCLTRADFAFEFSRQSFSSPYRETRGCYGGRKNGIQGTIWIIWAWDSEAVYSSQVSQSRSRSRAEDIPPSPLRLRLRVSLPSYITHSFAPFDTDTTASLALSLQVIDTSRTVPIAVSPASAMTR